MPITSGAWVEMAGHEAFHPFWLDSFYLDATSHEMQPVNPKQPQASTGKQKQPVNPKQPQAFPGQPRQPVNPKRPQASTAIHRQPDNPKQPQASPGKHRQPVNPKQSQACTGIHMHVTVTGCLPVLFLLATIISDLITEFKGHGHVPHLSEYQSWLPTTARESSNRTYIMHVRKDSTRIAGTKPHQPRYPSRPSALVRSNAHDYHRGTPVRCYHARDSPEATIELDSRRIPP